MNWFLIAVLVVGIITFFFLERKRKALTAEDRKKFLGRWQGIEALAEKDLEKALLEGDKLLDRALKQKGIKGQTMNERLKRAQKFFSDWRGIKKAHYLRNKIVHETDFFLSEQEGREALRSFRRALKELWG